MIDDWEQTKRDHARIERLIQQKRGQLKEILRSLKTFGINSLAEGIAAKKAGGEKERQAAVTWTKAEKAWRPKFEKVKELLEDSE